MPARTGKRLTIAREGEDACGAKLKGSRKRCPRPAGYGTHHPGTGYCKRHGGQTPNQLKANANAELSTLLEEPVDIDPTTALLWCVALAAQEVNWINDLISKRLDDDPIARPTRVRHTHKVVNDELRKVKEGSAEAHQMHLLVLERRDAIDRLARYSKMALDAGVAERLVQLAERMGELIAPLLEGVLEDLKLTAKQKERAPAVVSRHLHLLEQRVA